MQLNDYTVLDPLRSDGPKHNFYATVNPTTADDVTQGWTNGSRWININNDTHWVLIDEDNGIWIQTNQASAAADLEGVTVNFQWNTPSPLTLFTVKAGDEIHNCEVTITDGFDDPNARLSVGVFADLELIFPEKFSGRISKIGMYGTEENFIFTTNHTVILTIKPGTSTKGSGYVTCQVKRS